MSIDSHTIAFLYDHIDAYIHFALTKEFNVFFKQYRVTEQLLIVSQALEPSPSTCDRLRSTADLIYTTQSEHVLYQKMQSSDLKENELIVYLRVCTLLSKVYALHGEYHKVTELIRQTKLVLETKLVRRNSWAGLILPIASVVIRGIRAYWPILAKSSGQPAFTE